MTKVLAIAIKLINKGIVQAARLTFRQADAGASPRKACALAAVEALANRASAAYGGVRQMQRERGT